MKGVILLAVLVLLGAVLLFVFPACKKSECATCTSYVIGPDGSGGVAKDTIYTGARYCDGQLETARAEHGKYSQVGGARWTTIVNCW